MFCSFRATEDTVAIVFYWILSYKCRHFSANNTKTRVYLTQLSKQPHPLSSSCRTLDSESKPAVRSAQILHFLRGGFGGKVCICALMFAKIIVEPFLIVQHQN